MTILSAVVRYTTTGECVDTILASSTILTGYVDTVIDVHCKRKTAVTYYQSIKVNRYKNCKSKFTKLIFHLLLIYTVANLISLT